MRRLGKRRLGCRGEYTDRMCDGKLLRELERRRALPSRLRARLTDEPAQTRGSHTSRNASVRRRIAFVYRSPPHRVSPFLGALSSAAMNAAAMTAATRVADGLAC